MDELMVGAVRHAFYTRRGGVSRGLYTSLNCGFGSGDDRAHVAANRARAVAALDLPPDCLVTCHQHHSATVATIDGPEPPATPPKADAMVTTSRELALGVLTADCAPVLFADPDDGVIGAAHAGWRGALSGVLEATVDAMIELGARADNIVAAIGPCIGQASYEVGPEYPAPFLDEDTTNAAFFAPAARDGHYLFDLSGYVGKRLTRIGLGAVYRLDCDTCRDSSQFFSYRRSRLEGAPDYGREISIIALAA